MPISSSDFMIQPMALSDLEQVQIIEQQAHTHPWSEKLFLSNFGKRYFNHILSIQNGVAGYYVASYVAGEVTLLNIAIAPNLQGQGAGYRLMQHLIEQAKQLAQQEIWLEVRASNSAAIKLYQKLGFVEVDLRKEYYPTADGREDAIIMCKYL